MHASASPLEGLAERVNWLGVTVEGDVFGRGLLAAGVPQATIESWFSDPQVSFLYFAAILSFLYLLHSLPPPYPWRRLISRTLAFTRGTDELHIFCSEFLGHRGWPEAESV